MKNMNRPPHLPRLVAFATALVFCSSVLSSVHAQRPGGRRGAPTVDEPFVGITTSAGKQKGLFTIESTGVSTEPVRIAANAFLAGLTDQQRQRTVFPVDDTEWRKWDNRHSPKRQGVGFDEMTQDQRTLAFEMLQQSLSAKGLKKTKNIMKLNGTLGELAKKPQEYNEWLYWITVMGKPSETEPWGWQLDGHHVVINYFVLGDQVVMSPVFMGSEPVEAKQGKFAGTIVMQDEQDKGLKLIQMLNDEQRSEAVIMNRKDGNNNLTEAYKDNVKLDYAGLIGSKLDDAQKDALLQLIAEYVGNMREGHAKVRMSEVEKHLDETYFAWIGGTTDQSVYYYRVHSPVILIEFDHQRRVAPFRTSEPTRDHIHTVVRTPNGNDYGKDILRQHYESHSH
ncbi:DUF3500 domain-containing protein [Rhodopirellula baltica]|uniref:DUF3500 domain-containing protein n=1 Tax=Rhodopirellula baltica TaxID=265606 RepID=UPI0002DBA36C|nr:DUF3500 domain-containing protein [Rhodopirellula baltica]